MIVTTLKLLKGNKEETVYYGFKEVVFMHNIVRNEI